MFRNRRRDRTALDYLKTTGLLVAGALAVTVITMTIQELKVIHDFTKEQDEPEETCKEEKAAE